MLVLDTHTQTQLTASKYEERLSHGDQSAHITVMK